MIFRSHSVFPLNLNNLVHVAATAAILMHLWLWHMKAVGFFFLPKMYTHLTNTWGCAEIFNSVCGWGKWFQSFFHFSFNPSLVILTYVFVCTRKQAFSSSTMICQRENVWRTRLVSHSVTVLAVAILFHLAFSSLIVCFVKNTDVFF